jgi:addiction module RelB/DinJ family antitoxin
MNLRVDSKLKKSAENIISELGISTSAAITLYLKAIVREKGIPFPVTIEGKKKSVSSYRSRETEEDDILNDDDGVIDQESIKKAIDKF